jgi:uncharacterized protein (UPF0332 family)
MKNSQEDYIKYRFERAWKTFEDAKSLANLESWNSSMNRLYYACGLRFSVKRRTPHTQSEAWSKK